jgi:hypothetical protein
VWNEGFSFSEDVELPVFERPGTGAVVVALLREASSMRRFVCMCIERAYWARSDGGVGERGRSTGGAAKTSCEAGMLNESIVSTDEGRRRWE